jgi:hypothetical protein
MKDLIKLNNRERIAIRNRMTNALYNVLVLEGLVPDDPPVGSRSDTLYLQIKDALDQYLDCPVDDGN